MHECGRACARVCVCVCARVYLCDTEKTDAERQRGFSCWQCWSFDFQINCRCPGHDFPMTTRRGYLTRTTSYSRLRFNFTQSVVYVQYRCSSRKHHTLPLLATHPRRKPTALARCCCSHRKPTALARCCCSHCKPAALAWCCCSHRKPTALAWCCCSHRKLTALARCCCSHRKPTALARRCCSHRKPTALVHFRCFHHKPTNLQHPSHLIFHTFVKQS